jgi:hypothetical protein
LGPPAARPVLVLDTGAGCWPEGSDRWRRKPARYHDHAVPPVAFESMLSAPSTPIPSASPSLQPHAELVGAAPVEPSCSRYQKSNRILGLSTAVLGSGDRYRIPCGPGCHSGRNFPNNRPPTQAIAVSATGHLQTHAVQRTSALARTIVPLQPFTVIEFVARARAQECDGGSHRGASRRRLR